MHKKQWLRAFLCISSMMITASLAVNPPSPIPAIKPNPGLTPITNHTIVAPTVSPAQNAQVWNLKNADIRAVIQTISILTGKNFVIDPRVQGNITLVSQKPMTPNEMYQVFLSMLQLLQFSAIPSGNVIKIVPSTEAAGLTHQIATNTAPGVGEEVVVRVVPVKRVSAMELVPVLRPLMPQSGNITAYLPTNSLILAGTASNIQRITKVIAQMDNDNANQVNVVPLHYANAKKVVQMINALHNGPGQTGMNNAVVVADEDDNSILVSANATNQVLTRELIEQLDQPQAGGNDTKVVMLNYLTAKKLAPILTKIASGMAAAPSASGAAPAGLSGGKGSSGGEEAESSGGGVSGVSIQAEENNNAIIIHAPKEMMSSLVSVIHQLDHRPQEVLVEAIIVKIDVNLLNKLGIEWGTPNAAIGQAITNADGSSSMPGINANGDTLLKVATGGIGFLPDGNLLALLHTLKSDGSTDILSTPSVVVLNNDKATIDDGQNIGVANRSYQGTDQTQTAGTTAEITSPYNTIERTDVTLSLDVTPHISPNSMIQMDLLQKDDTIASDANSTQDNPTLNTSKIKTAVLVHSGDVLVLGGLISNDQEKTEQKIPVLGNIPLLGHLFSYNSNKIDKTSLMVFIRPIILSGAVARQQTSGRYRYVRDQQINAQTESVEDVLHPALLPKLTSHRNVTLPSPVSAMALPDPVQTTEK